MKRQFNSRGGGKVVRNQAWAEGVATDVFGLIAADPERLGAFLAETGLRLDEIRRAAGEPGFLGAILDHASADESRIVTLATELGVPPEDLSAARATLAPPEPDPFG